MSWSLFSLSTILIRLSTRPVSVLYAKADKAELPPAQTCGMLAVYGIDYQHPANGAGSYILNGYIEFYICIGFGIHWEDSVFGSLRNYFVDLAAMLTPAVFVALPLPKFYAFYAKTCTADTACCLFAFHFHSGNGLLATYFRALFSSFCNIV